MSLCQKSHRYLQEYSELAYSQDDQKGARHKCAACAYVEGLRDALNGHAKKTDLSHLPDSQAGTVRHRDAMEAYEEGYGYGRRLNS